jgi:hypothetical protein
VKHTALFSVLALSATFSIVACGDDPEVPTDDGAGASSGEGAGTTAAETTGGPTTTTTGEGGGPPMTQTRATANGDVTWTVTFDADAQAAGATDCSYTRHYEAIQDQSAPWLCPACDIVFHADVEMTEGQVDCFGQISTAEPLESEWIGFAGNTYYRGVGMNMTEQGTLSGDATMKTLMHAVADQPGPTAGTFSFAIAGSFTLGEEEGDPMHGFVPPETYACGWPKANPPAYTGDYTLAVGDTVPDGLFMDRCGETVRLHDFQGAYLLVEMGARDCPPCQAMAGEEEQFIADMAAQGITVYVVTLLAPSLSNTLGETTQPMLETWTNNYELTSPVLADRGWGLSMFVPIYQDQTGYPSIAVVAPDLTVLHEQVGFGSFEEISTMILADAQ